jgi:hypothetical protein
LISPAIPTMVHLVGPILCSILILACTAAPSSSRGNTSDPQVTRRWYSLPEDREAIPQVPRAWPVCRDVSRTIFYCFHEVEDYHTLHEIFTLALAKWAPAIRLSALDFALDPACAEEPCLCSELHVVETTPQTISNDSPGEPAITSLGYRSLTGNIGIQPGLPRHHLLWPSDSGLYGSNAILRMAQELGRYIYEQLSSMAMCGTLVAR